MGGRHSLALVSHYQDLFESHGMPSIVLTIDAALKVIVNFLIDHRVHMKS